MVNQDNTAKDINGFERAYVMLPVAYQIIVRDRIMRECGWLTFVTFHKKRKGKTKMRPPEITILEEIFAEYNLNPWTGKSISAQTYK